MQIIKIEVDDKSYARMLKGLRVEGTVGFDLRKKRGDLNAFNRLPRKRYRDILLKKLPWGRVTESIKNIKVHGSFPKDMGTAKMLTALEEHTLEAKNALIERELDLIEFC